VFQPFNADNIKNARIAEKMSNQDAVSMHIRRGDKISTSGNLLNWASELKSYKKIIELIWESDEFAKYKNKHLYVFSDDIPWTKAHQEELGLLIPSGGSITYVDWNHHYGSIHDMHLISLCKVVICSAGRFARTAACISKTVEYLVFVNPDTKAIQWKREGVV
jgi:hypothetical protein